MTVSTLVFMIPIGIVLLLMLLPSVNPVIGIVFFLMVNYEMWLVDMLLKYGIGKKSFLLKAAFYGLQFFLAISLIF